MIDRKIYFSELSQIGLESEKLVVQDGVNLSNRVDGIPTNDAVLSGIKDRGGEDLISNGVFQLEIDGSMVEHTASPATILGIGGAVDELILQQYVMIREIRRLNGGALAISPFSVPANIEAGYNIAVPQGKPPEVQTYYDRLISAYGTSMVVVGSHYHFSLPEQARDFFNGLSEEDIKVLMCRLGRDLACDLIAISASSPFYAGKMNGNHSERVLRFPRPDNIDVPYLYQSSEHHGQIARKLIENGDIYRWPNHLYTPIRPKPGSRVELRVPDLISDREYLEATALYFQLGMLNHILRHVDDTNYDYPYDGKALAIHRGNEESAAMFGPKAVVDKSLLKGEQSINLQEHVGRQLQEVRPLAQSLGVEKQLEPLRRFTQFGENPSVLLVDRYRSSGLDFEDFIRKETEQYQQQIFDEARSALHRVGPESSQTAKDLAGLINANYIM